jgi:hypothetical protein
MNLLWAALLGRAFGNMVGFIIAGSRRSAPPPRPADYSTGVPPPPFFRDRDCPLDHQAHTRCRMCEAIRAERENP